MQAAFQITGYRRAYLFQFIFLTIVALIGLPAAARAQVTITQSSSQTVASANTISCTNQTTGATTENSFWRAFTLSTYGITSAFAVQSVSFGIETAASGTGTTQPLDVRIYANTGAAFPGGTRTLLKTASIAVNDQDLTVLSVPITATIPAGNQLVLEIHVPDGTAAGHIFFPGSNTAAETGPSYISAASCGVTNPTTYAAIGFPTVHLVMNVTGLAVTAAGTSISGNVLAGGKGLANARVELTGTGGTTRAVTTNAFGNFTFDDVDSGATYVVNVSAKKYTFAPQVISVTNNISGLSFKAQ